MPHQGKNEVVELLRVSCEFDSRRGYHAGASLVTIAPFFFKGQSSLYTAAPSFQTEPTVFEIRFGAASSRRRYLITRK